MEKEYSANWKSSKQPRKQRKYRHNAPLHVRQGLMNVHLSSELKKKYGLRSVGIRKGDKVTIVRGQFKKKSGKVENVDLKKGKATISGIEIPKKDGTKTTYPITPSNLILNDLETDDKFRQKILGRKKVKEK